MEDRQKTGDVLRATVPEALAGERLDRVLGRLFDGYSRARMQRWVRAGHVAVDGEPCHETRRRMSGGEHLSVATQSDPQQTWGPQAMDLRVVLEDPHLLVIDKPAGLVVHPGAGNPDRTLVNALVHFDPALAALPRAGLVHRLDKDTTGLMVVARSFEAQTRLTRQIAAREVRREYQAVVHGVAAASGRVDAPVGRHPLQRTRMAVRDGGRRAVTHWRRVAAFERHSHLTLVLETGRTHQIRVHMAHIGHPIVGDRDYGGVRPPPATLDPHAAQAVAGFARQALHACRLELAHPVTGAAVAVDSPLPDDIATLVSALSGDIRR